MPVTNLSSHMVLPFRTLSAWGQLQCALAHTTGLELQFLPPECAELQFLLEGTEIGGLLLFADFVKAFVGLFCLTICPNSFGMPHTGMLHIGTMICDNSLEGDS